MKEAPSLDRKRSATDENESATGRNASSNGTGLFSIITEAEQGGGGDRGPNNGGPTPYAPVDENSYSTELMDLGMSEAPPPYEIIEAL